MTKEQIIRYIMQTPENTNPGVLSTMLDIYKESQVLSSADDINNIGEESKGKDVHLSLDSTTFEEGMKLSSKFQNMENPPRLYISLKGCTFNSANKGSKQIYLTNCKELILENCIFENNDISDYGLDVNLCGVLGANIRISNCVFKNNGTKSAISIKQRRGPTDHPTDITNSQGTIASVLIEECSFEGNIIDMKVGTSPKGEDTEANTSTGNYPLIIRNNNTDMKIQLTYLAGKDEIPQEIIIKAKEYKSFN